ncbi:membrane protein insertion efficiency factor YidD [Microbulbifer elongatus]|uniref:Putative membrane protein insertion efficiency factor n=1 Tax=Microbulbifer elongatus TaxID=86173 RepID=A0ABT1P492_9GAMM|nr:membrane protein insertion efficiency factor YidD [Microbulbifer elongatus]
MTWLAIKLIHLYRLIASPWVGNQCRFYPTCSCYAEQALKTHGFCKGGYLTLRRLIKCHPWHPGGLDHVPPANHAPESPATAEAPLKQQG